MLKEKETGEKGVNPKDQKRKGSKLWEKRENEGGEGGTGKNAGGRGKAGEKETEKEKGARGDEIECTF